MVTFTFHFLPNGIKTFIRGFVEKKNIQFRFLHCLWVGVYTGSVLFGKLDYCLKRNDHNQVLSKLQASSRIFSALMRAGHSLPRRDSFADELKERLRGRLTGTRGTRSDWVIASYISFPGHSRALARKSRELKKMASSKSKNQSLLAAKKKASQTMGEL